jgi:hypothetical protein
VRAPSAFACDVRLAVIDAAELAYATDHVARDVSRVAHDAPLFARDVVDIMRGATVGARGSVTFPPQAFLFHARNRPVDFSSTRASRCNTYVFLRPSSAFSDA